MTGTSCLNYNLGWTCLLEAKNPSHVWKGSRDPIDLRTGANVCTPCLVIHRCDFKAMEVSEVQWWCLHTEFTLMDERERKIADKIVNEVTGGANGTFTAEVTLGGVYNWSVQAARAVLRDRQKRGGARLTAPVERAAQRCNPDPLGSMPLVGYVTSGPDGPITKQYRVEVPPVEVQLHAFTDLATQAVPMIPFEEPHEGSTRVHVDIPADGPMVTSMISPEALEQRLMSTFPQAESLLSWQRRIAEGILSAARPTDSVGATRKRIQEAFKSHLTANPELAGLSEEGNVIQQ